MQTGGQLELASNDLVFTYNAVDSEAVLHVGDSLRINFAINYRDANRRIGLLFRYVLNSKQFLQFERYRKARIRFVSCPI